MQEKIQQAIFDNWEKIGNASKKPKKLYAILLNGTRYKKTSFARIVLLYFIPGAETPFLVVKLYKDQKTNIQMKTEFEILQAMNRHGFGYSPSVKKLLVVDGYTVLFEEYVDGFSMEKQMRDSLLSGMENKQNILRLFQNHLHISEKIYKSLRKLPMYPKKNINANDELSACLKEFRLNFDISKHDGLLHDAMIRRIKHVLRTDHGKKTLVNWDFSPHNILLPPKKNPKLIDWEFSSFSALSFLEPMHMVHYYIKFFIDHKCIDATFPEIFISILHKGSDISKIIHAYFHSIFGSKITGRQIADYMAFFLITEACIQKRALSIFPNDWQVYYIDAVRMLCLWRNHGKPIVFDIPQLTQQQDYLFKKNQELQHRINNYEKKIKELGSLTQTRGWKIVSAVHRVRKKIPGLHRL